MDLGLLQIDVATLFRASTDTNGENGRGEPQIKLRTLVISFLGSNPFGTDQETFGGKLQAWRTAKRLGVNKSMITEWERHYHLPHTGTLRRVQELIQELTKPPNR